MIQKKGPNANSGRQSGEQSWETKVYRSLATGVGRTLALHRQLLFDYLTQRGIVERAAHKVTIDEEAGRAADSQARSFFVIAFYSRSLFARIKTLIELRRIQLQRSRLGFELVHIEFLAAI